MANKALLQEMDGTPPQITFADFSGDFGPASANDLRHPSAVDTEVQMAVSSSYGGFADGGAYESDKADLGEHRAHAYKCRTVVEFFSGFFPDGGQAVEHYWGPSQTSVAANANPGSLSGSDGDHPTSGSELANAVKQLDFIGNAIVIAEYGTQIMETGVLVPTERYGGLVLKNESGTIVSYNDDVETHVVLDPIIDELQ